jgi:hypothetical protein
MRIKQMQVIRSCLLEIRIGKWFYSRIPKEILPEFDRAIPEFESVCKLSKSGQELIGLWNILRLWRGC